MDTFVYSKEEEEFRIRLRNIKLRKFTRTKRLGRGGIREME